jgi:hypothetical protein
VRPVISFHYFALPRYPAEFELRGSEALGEMLEPVGVVVMPESGVVIYAVDQADGQVMRRSGSVHVYPEGRIEVRPHRRTAESDRCGLLQTAHLAFMRKPATRDGWRVRREGGRRVWWKNVWILAAPDDPVSIAAASMDDITVSR